jgi:hypothetical protein
MKCKHKWESNDFRAKCVKCGISFAYLVNPKRYNKNGIKQ